MFVASVALSYGAWEAYVEDVAIEVTRFLAEKVDPSNVPNSARVSIESGKPTAWELAVSPGWRHLWVSGVSRSAKGDEAANVFGMNTAGTRQIVRLSEAVGLDLLEGVTKGDREAIDELVIARGKVVHTATPPDDFNKAKAREYRDLVLRVSGAVDSNLRSQCHSLTGEYPW